MKYFGILFVFLSLIACDSPTKTADEFLTPIKHGVFIANEGSFSAANASLSFFDADSGIIQNNVFQIANGEALGSVANSIFVRDTLVYIVVNNSDKIEVISANSIKRVKKITLPSGSSPRQMAFAEHNKAYVSNLYTNSVSVLDLASGDVLTSIPVGSNPEGLVLSDNKLFVANSGFGNGNTISVIDAIADTVTGTIDVADNPISMRKSAAGDVVVLCSGAYGDFTDPNDDTPGGLFVIDPRSETVRDSLLIDEHISRLTLDESGGGYFLGNDGIMKFTYNNSGLLSSLLTAGFYYNIEYDADQQMIYALDAKDFVQAGDLVQVDINGSEIGRYPAGLIPGSVAFFNAK